MEGWKGGVYPPFFLHLSLYTLQLDLAGHSWKAGSILLPLAFQQPSSFSIYTLFQFYYNEQRTLY